MKIKKTVIITGYKCNNSCQFCISANKRHLPDKTSSQIIAEMLYARKRKRTYLEIIGGEQTIRPDFIYLISTANKLGFKDIVMATNGRMLSYMSYAEELIKAGITGINFSIHGHNNQLHDSLTQSRGSFNELLQAIDNVKKLGFNNIGSNTTVVKQNYRSLPAIGEFIYNLGIRNAEFIFVDPIQGGAFNNFKRLVPKISSAAGYIRRCLDIGRKNRIGHWKIRYVPLCQFIGYENQISELFEVKYFNTEHLAPDFRNYDVEKSRAVIGRIKTDKCKRCAYFKYCEGIWKPYIDHYGDSELQPVKSGVNIEDIGFERIRDIKQINMKEINPYVKHPDNLLRNKIYLKDIFSKRRYIELKNSHLAAISGIKNRIKSGADIEPIVIDAIEDKNYRYNLVDGFCRYMAFNQLGFKKIKCIVRNSQTVS